ncbi:MAG TPA: alpha/beta hydrolase [Roseiflexaceae bacterium]|nr:alpha/beta hydrolase [Roseiflexaceae bacterium]HMP43116.1 alpha/beta hydrolase [Roseiflexaceae bacterium]
MEPWAAADLEIRGVRLRYHRTGGGGEAVVLVHGLTDHGLYWSALARELAHDYDVVFYDSRGHGASGTSPDGYELTTLAADLVALVQALGLQRPALIGHSMGGSTASLAAATTPGLFRALILEDPVWSSGTGGPPLDLNERRLQWREQIRARQQRDRATLLAEVQAESPSWSAEDYERWIDSKLAVRPEALDVMPSLARNWLADAQQIDCPLLVLTGEPERGAIVDPIAEQALLAAQPLARVLRLSGTGHQVRRERFDAYLPAVREFLAAHRQ